jgi:protein-L-isoaspartate(D-aspartate) O-methyltransferase
MSLPLRPGWDGSGAEAKAEFLLRLRARGIRDLAVLRALEAVPRDIFVPHRYVDLAAKEVALPIPCGQTMSAPYFVARMVEALAVKPSCRVLEIGSGSGYATAILARLALDVVGLERYQSLALQARTRLEGLGLTNAKVLWEDGLAFAGKTGPFDRLLIHAVVDEVPATLLDRLTGEAVMVYARPAGPQPGARQELMRAQRINTSAGTAQDGAWHHTIVCPARLRVLDPGRSQAL